MNLLYLLTFFKIKLFLDFFSTSRELNFIIQSLFLVFMILKSGNQIALNAKMKINFAIYNILLLIALSQTQKDYGTYLKLVSLNLYAVYFFSVGLSYSTEKVRYLVKKYLMYFTILYAANLVYSIYTGDYQERRVHNFEHVNLMGTYINSALILLIYKNNSSQYDKKSSIMFLVMSYLSKSTGSLMVTALSLFKVSKNVFKSTLKYTILAFISVFLIFYFTDKFNTELHYKIFGFLELFTSKEITYTEFRSLAVEQELDLYQLNRKGVLKESSFTWRMFSSNFYASEYLGQPVSRMLIGNGFGGWRKFARFMPHNDFLLVLMDFGLLGFLFFFYHGLQAVRYVFKHNFQLISIVMLIFLKLIAENVIYSYYNLSSLVMCVALVIGSETAKKFRTIK